VVTQNLRAVVYILREDHPLFGPIKIPVANTFNMYQHVCLKHKKPKPNFNVIFLLNEGISSIFLNEENGKIAAPFYHKFLKDQKESIWYCMSRRFGDSMAIFMTK
jgi:hypothetical protein